MSGKRAFLELLKQEGVEILFGNPGTTELPLMDALSVDNELRYVLGLQEATVIGMADGYAQASGKLAAVNLHVAPGLGNAMGMLYDAQKAGSPILVTAGQHDQDFNSTEPILWADLPPIARPLVKWSAEVHRLADLPRLVHRAAKTALAPPTGPVFLALPGDILKAEGELDLMAPTRVAAGLRGDPVAVEEAAAMLAQSKRPLIVAGDAVARGRAHAELVELAELLGAPVYAELVPSTASFPASHPLFRGAMTRMQGPIRKILEQYDVLFSVGGDLFTLSLPSDIEPMPPDLTLIHLDNDPWELGKNYPPKVAILGDPKTTLPDVTKAVRERMSSGARAAARERFEAAKRATLAEREALSRQGARAGGSDAGAAARLARSHRRDAAERRGRDRRDDFVGRRHPLAHCAATIRKAFTACAAAASAGACRPRSASSSLCPTGRWWRSSATAAPCIPARRCGRRRTSASLPSSSFSTTRRTGFSSSACMRSAGLPRRSTASSAWSSPIRRSIMSGSPARSASPPSAPTTVRDTTDLIAKGLQSNAPLLIDVATDRNYKPV